MLPFLITQTLDITVVTAAIVPLVTTIGILWKRLLYVEDSRHADKDKFVAVMQDFTLAIKDLSAEARRVFNSKQAS